MAKQKAHVSESKVKIVKELEDLIKNSKTILISSIKGIPGSQFQEISKKLRGKAIVKVPKKNLIFRAIDDSENPEVQKLKEQIQASIAILFSELDSFELAAELVKNKSPAKAKPGQEAPEDIEIPDGPTDLVPGPAVSELGALGIQIQIEKGKINIKEPKVIAKQGQKISRAAADIMVKLDIKPFSIGFTPLAAFDTKENKLYTEIKIDRDETLNELKTAYSKAIPFAVEIGYITEDTIKFLIQKVGRHANALEKLSPAKEREEKEPQEETVNDNRTESNGKQNTGDKLTTNESNNETPEENKSEEKEKEDKEEELAKPDEEPKEEEKNE